MKPAVRSAASIQQTLSGIPTVRAITLTGMGDPTSNPAPFDMIEYATSRNIA